jgi:hypothetical protein
LKTFFNLAEKRRIFACFGDLHRSTQGQGSTIVQQFTTVASTLYCVGRRKHEERATEYQETVEEQNKVRVTRLLE